MMAISSLTLVSADQNFFPIIGYFADNLEQAQGCGINTALIYYRSDREWLDSLFNEADRLHMKLILASASIPGLPPTYNYQRLSSGEFAQYQAESISLSTHFSIINDHHAVGGKALAIISLPGEWTGIGPMHEISRLPGRGEFLDYKIRIQLKMTRTTSDTILGQVALWKINNGDTIVKAIHNLHRSQFHIINNYYDLEIPYKIDSNDKGKLCLVIQNQTLPGTIVLDNITFMDPITDSLKNESYTPYIRKIASYYKNKKALLSFYLFDEPSASQLEAARRISEIIRSVSSRIITVQAINNPSLFDIFLKTVPTHVLFIDKYPLFGTPFIWGRTPVDSGVLFEERMNDYCLTLSAAALAVKRNKKDFWLIVQSFGQAVTDKKYSWKPIWTNRLPPEDEGWWREPTYNELRCMVWLGLAYGAKGISYFLFPSVIEQFNTGNYQDFHWNLGLSDPNGNIRNNLWNSVRSINYEILKVTSLLHDLTVDTTFNSDLTNPPFYMYSIDNSMLTIGLFSNPNKRDEKYFMVVNRKCSTSDKIQTKVSLVIPQSSAPRLFDFTSGKAINPFTIVSSENDISIVTYNIDLEPGQGKLLRIEK